MLARIWGCRGSLASPGPHTVRYGGNTSCVEVRLDSGDVIILDAGTGMRPLGVEMSQNPPERIHLLLTHLHLDHVQGFGFFRPLFRNDVEVHIWGPSSPVQTLSERIGIYLSPPLFPVRLADIPARLVFHDEPEDLIIGSAQISAAKVAHQGPTLGYRIVENDRVFAYIPDHEPSLGVVLDEQPASWISGHDVAYGADLLFHDAQFSDDEYPDHVGWGHSCVDHVMSFAEKTKVGEVVLFHHDPYKTDDELEVLLEHARKRSRSEDRRLHLACEGMTCVLDDDGVRVSANCVEQPEVPH
jgi:phosphoribosyl 1,2-cyclic phosphodiesterase